MHVIVHEYRGGLVLNLSRVLSLAGLAASPLLCQAQACLPYGAPISQGSTVCLQPTGGTPYGPVPPNIFFTGQGGGCDANQGGLYTFYNEIDARAQKLYHSSIGLFVTPVVPGGVVAYLDWSSNYFANPWDPGFYEGGNATFSSAVNGSSTGATVFTIAGVNPSTQLLTAAMQSYGPPWYFGRLLTHESSNRQFWGSQYNYTPLYGQPDGFGVAQLDGTNPFGTTTNSSNQIVTIPKLTDAVLWNWYLNLAEGMGLAWSKQLDAYKWFSSQTAQAAAVNVPPPQPSVQYGTCFPMSWYGSGETGAQDAEWITVYNGGHFATYNNIPKTWTLRTGYVDAICNAPSATIPNG